LLLEIVENLVLGQLLIELRQMMLRAVLDRHFRRERGRVLPEWKFEIEVEVGG
jgi:hypothetical protein